MVSVVGAGGHGREVWGVLRAIERAGASEIQPHGFYDDQAPDARLLDRISGTWLGEVREVDSPFLIGIGDSRVRRTVAQKVSVEPAIAVHPGAFLDDDVRIQPGVVIFAGATVTTNIDLGLHTHIGRGAAVGHDTVVEDFVTVMPLASVSGNVRLGAGCTIGAGAVIRQGISVGAEAFVGAGAIVVKDVPPGVTVVGNPARLLNR
ncbi:acetyltransferase [Corynebacterium atrinae]